MVRVKVTFASGQEPVCSAYAPVLLADALPARMKLMLNPAGLALPFTLLNSVRKLMSVPPAMVMFVAAEGTCRNLFHTPASLIHASLTCVHAPACFTYMTGALMNALVL
jgi:hypothetical protein